MSVDTPKNVNVPLDSTTADLLEYASGYTGLDKIQFILESIQEKARAIIEAREKTTFTEDDWRMFFALRENPPEPTEAIKIASETPKASAVPQFSEQELLDHPLLQVSGLLAIGEPGWADRHDKYLGDIYEEDNANDK